MRSSLYIFTTCLFLGTFCACGDPDLTALNTKMDEAHTVLVTEEHWVIEHFFDHQEFHNGLIMEVIDRTQQPYPVLTELLAEMRAEMVLMQQERAVFYNKNAEVRDSLMKALNSSSAVPQAAYDQLNARLEEGVRVAQTYDAQFKSLEETYDSLCTVHHITFISHADYADSLLVRIMQWEDSLEAQGSSVAKSMQKLNAQGWERRSDTYLKKYKPISEMQSLHKKLEQAITGANNAHNRYDSSRPTDGYYTGPYVVERHDVDATEEIFPGLDSLMTEFRSYQLLFDSSLN